MPSFAGEVDEDILRTVLSSARRRVPCELEVFSAVRGAERSLWCPHSFFEDGGLLHVRGWVSARSRFSDLRLAHIFSARDGTGEWVPQAADTTWNETVRLSLVPNPGLARGRRVLVERERGMRDGRATVTARKAMAWRLLARLGLLEAIRTGLPGPSEAPVWPEDPGEARRLCDGIELE